MRSHALLLCLLLSNNFSLLSRLSLSNLLLLRRLRLCRCLHLRRLLLLLLRLSLSNLLLLCRLGLCSCLLGGHALLVSLLLSSNLHLLRRLGLSSLFRHRCLLLLLRLSLSSLLLLHRLGLSCHLLFRRLGIILLGGCSELRLSSRDRLCLCFRFLLLRFACLGVCRLPRVFLALRRSSSSSGFGGRRGGCGSERRGFGHGLVGATAPNILQVEALPPHQAPLSPLHCCRSSSHRSNHLALACFRREIFFFGLVVGLLFLARRRLFGVCPHLFCIGILFVLQGVYLFRVVLLVKKHCCRALA
mmetsp:Transcript_20175/g.29582  ORF Transcript_20175/g.29582 Transcript_20175/m.29582 type:complete len:302 (-) Transcript_20175:44-949(-)